MTTTATLASRPLDPLPPDAFGPDQARHLLLRAGFGGSPAEVDALAAMGVDAAVDRLVDYEAIDFEPDARDAFRSDVMRPYSEQERRITDAARRRRDEDTLAVFRKRRQEAQAADRRQMAEIRRWWLARMVATPRPLEEKLTLTWHGHFATSYRTVEDSYHLYAQNRVFRGNAKSFPRLLMGIIRDPAMLRYLNNDRNRRGSPNENLARELLELFALGEGNYTERDIKEGARALTGYTFEDDAFVFRKERHDQGIKFILGSQGRLDGDGFVQIILRQPACAAFVANRLYRAFVADVPPQPRDLDGVHREAVIALSDRVWRDGYELGGALKALFRSRHFYSDAVVGRKIKSPAELVVGALRTLGVPAGTPPPDALLSAMERMGQNLFYPPSVKGWDGGRAWINTATLFARQNVLAQIVRGAQRDLPQALAGTARTPDAVAARVLALTLGRPDERAERALAGLLGARPDPASPVALGEALTLATALPEYQLC